VIAKIVDLMLVREVVYGVVGDPTFLDVP